ncbi:MAG: hypothetical protein KDD56_05840, partial [Bdellovibrionales bacterium]|nr:hypothetical protein [Bdellovibrionales bacterium]
ASGVIKSFDVFKHINSQGLLLLEFEPSLEKYYSGIYKKQIQYHFDNLERGLDELSLFENSLHIFKLIFNFTSNYYILNPSLDDVPVTDSLLLEDKTINKDFWSLLLLNNLSIRSILDLDSQDSLVIGQGSDFKSFDLKFCIFRGVAEKERKFLRELGAISFCALRLVKKTGELIGHLVGYNSRPTPVHSYQLALTKILAEKFTFLY